jgi:hypothetical protein
MGDMGNAADAFRELHGERVRLLREGSSMRKGKRPTYGKAAKAFIRRLRSDVERQHMAGKADTYVRGVRNLGKISPEAEQAAAGFLDRLPVNLESVLREDFPDSLCHVMDIMKENPDKYNSSIYVGNWAELIYTAVKHYHKKLGLEYPKIAPGKMTLFGILRDYGVLHPSLVGAVTREGALHEDVRQTVSESHGLAGVELMNANGMIVSADKTPELYSVMVNHCDPLADKSETAWAAAIVGVAEQLNALAYSTQYREEKLSFPDVFTMMAGNLFKDRRVPIVQDNTYLRKYMILMDGEYDKEDAKNVVVPPYQMAKRLVLPRAA